VLDVGENPHQVAFSSDGRYAFVAASGSGRITRIDTETLQAVGTVWAPGSPLGVASIGVGPSGESQLLIARWGGREVTRVGLPAAPDAAVDLTSEAVTSVETGASPSFLVGPLPGWGPIPGGSYIAVNEGENSLSVLAEGPRSLDPSAFRLSLQSAGPSGGPDWTSGGDALTEIASYPTGTRPFPPAATSDGRLAFVPDYGDGTVTVVDLWNERVVATTPVGERPSGGSVLPGDIDYAVAVRGEDKVVFVNTGTWHVSGELSEGIGDEPFSVVVSPNGRLAFVNNTASHDVSVIDLDERRVVTRISVGEIPIALAVHPDGSTLWVSSEGSHTLTVLAIPEAWRSPESDPGAGVEAGASARVSAEAETGPRAVTDSARADSSAAGPATEVAVMGMIHGSHRTSERWGLDQVRETIRRLDPDVICIEVPPNRWDRIWSDYTERGVMEDLRIRPFPEYTDVILPLTREMDFEIVPCAGWSVEMNTLRSTRSRLFDEDPRWAGVRADFRAATDAMRAALPEPAGESDDPYYLHSDSYDDRARASYIPRSIYQNELFGLGGWININDAHMALIERTIQEHRGTRILVTFGAGHKYWYMDRLRGRDDVRLLDLREYLPDAPS